MAATRNNPEKLCKGRFSSARTILLSGVVGFGVLPASGAESASYRLRVDAVAYHLPGETASKTVISTVYR